MSFHKTKFKKIKKENIRKELRIQEEINKSIDENKSMVFESGAGAGKTYALAESLKYVIKNHGSKLAELGQSVICITYTNVATDELKNRVRDSNQILISTIHERMWDLIKGHQKGLIEIHKAKLENEIEKIQTALETKSEFEKYRELPIGDRGKFQDIMEDTKDEYYKNYYKNAAEFKIAISSRNFKYNELMKNVLNFKKLVNSLFRLKKFQEAIKNIDKGVSTFDKVEYTSKINRDKLEQMKISHDTLIEYSFEMFRRYKILRQIVIDKYPYVFIDEYQDTSPNIIKIMNLLENYSKEINHPIFIGYYGDSAQNIYQGGVGVDLDELHSNLKVIKKEFNRRSSVDVINLINNIRKDGITQESIYEDSKCGGIEFYSGSEEKIEEMIEACFKDWNIGEENDEGVNGINCFSLTNEEVARRSGFKNLYEIIKKMPRYKIKYDQLNLELLANNDTQLGYVQRILKQIIEISVTVEDGKNPIQKLISKTALKQTNLIQLRELVSKFKSIKGDSFEEYLNSLIRVHNELDKKCHKEIIAELFPDNVVTKDSIINLITVEWGPKNDEDLEGYRSTIQALFRINMVEFKNWVKLLNRKYYGNITHHTYHGTKGLEFDSVLILMKNKFGNDKNFFGKYFNAYPDSYESDEKLSKAYNQARNLLYVSCSRSIKNLRVYYYDDIEVVREGVEKIFGEIKTFS